jgi:hypothetical protein
MLDRSAFADACHRIEALGVNTIAGAHSPTIASSHTDEAFTLLRRLPDTAAPLQPGHCGAGR